jgi:hypothetical protein
MFVFLHVTNLVSAGRFLQKEKYGIVTIRFILVPSKNLDYLKNNELNMIKM